MDEPRFQAAQFDTNFLEGWLAARRLILTFNADPEEQAWP